jgi:hypothetical protein
MSTPDDTAVITLKDVYHEVQKVRDSVALVPTYGTQLGDHETRIRALERWRYSGHAAAGISISSLVTAVAAILHR